MQYMSPGKKLLATLMTSDKCALLLVMAVFHYAVLGLGKHYGTTTHQHGPTAVSHTASLPQPLPTSFTGPYCVHWEQRNGLVV